VLYDIDAHKYRIPSPKRDVFYLAGSSYRLSLSTEPQTTTLDLPQLAHLPSRTSISPADRRRSAASITSLLVIASIAARQAKQKAAPS